MRTALDGTGFKKGANRHFPFHTLLFTFFLLTMIACSSGSSAPVPDGSGDSGGDATDTDTGGVQASCDDGILNQDEIGIDCGGSCSACFSGTTYYVANSGDNDADGLTPDTAWRTIDRVNGEPGLKPGDAVLFQRGDTWREELVITWSGAPGAPITFGAYGTGDKPRILGSERATDWSPVGGVANVWQSATALDWPRAGYGDAHPSSIFFGEKDDSVTWGRVQDIHEVNACGTGFSQLQQEYDWCWESDAIYVYAPEDPDTHYAYVEVPQREGSITMVTHEPQEYIVIDGLELMFGVMYGYNDGWPMRYEVSGLTIRNCHIGYIGIRGGDSAMGMVIWHSDMLVQNNDVHDCGRRSISYNVYTDTSNHPPNQVFDNVLFEGNVLHNGYHTTGFDISHGSAESGTFSDFTFRNNFIWDDPTDDPTEDYAVDQNDFTSMGLYLESHAAVFKDFKVYNNIFMYLKQKAIAVSGVDNLQIYNNTLYGMNPNIDNYRAIVHIAGDNENFLFNNNIIHGTVSADLFPARCFLISGDTTVVSIDNNLYFQDDDRQALQYVVTTSYYTDDWNQYRADTGWDGNSPAPLNPLFVDAEGGDFHLRWSAGAKSPAIDAGRAIDDRTTDFYGNPIVGTPDIGAVEYQN